MATQDWSSLLARTVVLAVILFALFFTAAQSLAASVEQVALLKSANREKVLIEGAKKEGKVVCGSVSDNQPDISRSGYEPRSRPKGMFNPLWIPQECCARRKRRGILDLI